MDCAVGKARSTCAFAGAQACRLATKGMRPGEHRSRRQACKPCSARGCMTAAKQPICTWITRSPFVEKVLKTHAQHFARPVLFEKVRTPAGWAFPPCQLCRGWGMFSKALLRKDFVLPHALV